MKKQLLVTAAGEDRPGIVARLTEVFVKHGANLEESRMSILGGEFAAIILVTVPDGRIDALKKELSALDDETITVTTKNTQALDANRFAGHAHFDLTLTGADHEGIVHKISRFLRDREINIQSMDTDILNAPETGTPLFRMKATVLVPASITQAELQRHLKEIADQESVDITATAHAPETVVI